MLHQTDLGNARMADMIESARRDAERRRLNNRGSPIRSTATRRRISLLGGSDVPIRDTKTFDGQKTRKTALALPSGPGWTTELR